MRESQKCSRLTHQYNSPRFWIILKMTLKVIENDLESYCSYCNLSKLNISEHKHVLTTGCAYWWILGNHTWVIARTVVAEMKDCSRSLSVSIPNMFVTYWLLESRVFWPPNRHLVRENINWPSHIVLCCCDGCGALCDARRTIQVRVVDYTLTCSREWYVHHQCRILASVLSPLSCKYTVPTRSPIDITQKS